jgi:hypothetical protein
VREVLEGVALKAPPGGDRRAHEPASASTAQRLWLGGERPRARRPVVGAGDRRSWLAWLIGRGDAGDLEQYVPMFKQLFGVSRKQAIPLLEDLDHQGVTRRQGDERVLGPANEKGNRTKGTSDSRREGFAPRRTRRLEFSV